MGKQEELQVEHCSKLLDCVQVCAGVGRCHSWSWAGMASRRYTAVTVAIGVSNWALSDGCTYYRVGILWVRGLMDITAQC